RARTVMGTKNSDGSMDEPSFVLQLGFDGSSKPRFDGYGGEKIGPSRVPLGGRRDPEQLLRGTSERDEASLRIEDLGFDVVRARCGALYLNRTEADPAPLDELTDLRQASRQLEEPLR